MSEIIKRIFEIKKSKSYIEYNNYHAGNIFGITKVSRWELMHSNFIAWSLNPDASHNLNYFPILQLIKSLEFIKNKPDNELSRLDVDIIRKFYEDNYIVHATVEREVKHIDILIKIETKDKILPIVIENKVESKENGPNENQTKVYFDWAEKEFDDKSKYFDPIYIFLLPDYNSKVKQKEEKYLRMTYQELVDYIIEPSMLICGNQESINNYKVYLQCLSFQTDNEKGEYSMAISSDERKILDNFIKENKNLLCSVLNELKDDLDENAINAITSNIRDYSTYSFDGNVYSKSRLVLAVIKKYVADHNTINYDDLKKVFPDDLQGTKGVVKLSTSVSDKDQGIGGQKRYFVDDPIKLSSGEIVLVCTQWSSGNIDCFIESVQSKIGYNISKL